MNEGKASRTAMMVAYMRAVADAGATHVRDFHDPTARVYLNAKWSARLAKITEQVRAGRETVSLAVSRVSADMMALRTKTIDAAVCDAIHDGTTQLVILGAGLDGRAWRMNELRGVRVFEVDHPATQAFKRAHVDRLPPAIGDVVVRSDRLRARVARRRAVAGGSRRVAADVLDLGRRGDVPDARRRCARRSRTSRGAARRDRR